MAYQTHEAGGGMGSFYGLLIVGEGAPGIGAGNGAGQGSHVIGQLLDQVIGQGCHGGAVLAQNFRGDTLLHHLGQSGVANELQLVMAVSVEEAGGQSQTGGVHHLPIAFGGDDTDLRDHGAVDENIGMEGLAAGAVIDDGILDQSFFQ